jgi:hypothetical protein
MLDSFPLKISLISSGLTLFFAELSDDCTAIGLGCGRRNQRALSYASGRRYSRCLLRQLGTRHRRLFPKCYQVRTNLDRDVEISYLPDALAFCPNVSRAKLSFTSFLFGKEPGREKKPDSNTQLQRSKAVSILAII